MDITDTLLIFYACIVGSMLYKIRFYKVTSRWGRAIKTGTMTLTLYLACCGYLYVFPLLDPTLMEKMTRQLAWHPESFGIIQFNTALISAFTSILVTELEAV